MLRACAEQGILIMRTKQRTNARPSRGHSRSIRETLPKVAKRRNSKQPDRRGPKRLRRCQEPNRKPSIVEPPAHIMYRTPPWDRAERSRRRAEQRRLAKRRTKKRKGGRNNGWITFSYAEKDRRIRFGSKAVCRNPRDVRDLARINARIAHKREISAVRTWRLTSNQISQFKRCVGFSWAGALFAGNKAVRVETAYRLSLLMAQIFRNRRRHFYWITIIHSGWHDGHHNTRIPLSEIKRRTQTVMKRAGLNWFGMIEFDIFNNWPYSGRGLRLTPHVHLLAWGNRHNTPAKIRSQLNLAGLRSLNGANVVVVKSVKNAKRLAHFCYYMTKPNHLVKSLGKERPDTSKRPIYSVEKNVRPGHTLRIAEILSYMKISELMMAQGEGRRIKGQIISALTSGAVLASYHDRMATEVSQMWESMMPASRVSKAHVMVDRDNIL